MALDDSSDDENPSNTDFVDSFHIEDQDDEPVSIAELPLWTADESRVGQRKKIGNYHLRGKGKNGLPIMCGITAWKIEYHRNTPVFFVREMKGNWIRLGRPKTAYAKGAFRSIYIVGHFISFVKKNMFATQKIVMEYLRKICSWSETELSIGDILEHAMLIKEIVKRDEDLETADIIKGIIKKRVGPPLVSVAKKRKVIFPKGDIVDEDKEEEESEEEEGDGDDDDNDDEEEEDNQEAVCAICDDGGKLVCCDGPCLRSFHGTKSAAAELTSNCRSLCLDESEVKENTKFYCLNCKYNQHQCFACGKLGASDGESREVILCDVAFCGRFYHPSCVSLPDDFASGNKAFTCPLHKCKKCNEVDKKDCEDNRLYMCRRCPSAWHKKCIKDKIKFDGDPEESDDEDEREVRGWKLYKPRQGCARIMYCLKHIILEDLGTPKRNHLRFPEPPVVRKAAHPIPALKELKKMTPINSRDHAKSKDVLLKSNKDVIEDGVRVEDSVVATETKKVVGDLLPPKKKAPLSSVANGSLNSKEDVSVRSTAVKLPSYAEAEVNKVIYAIIAKSRKEVTMDYIQSKLTTPSTVSYVPNKSIQLGKIESALRAFHRAAECFKSPGGREEAQCILPPASLKYLEGSKDTLKIYLAPFLHGRRYSSFGRHFTQVDKLKKIVDKLHWYVEPGDMVVDFCCGANDFSKLMHEKLMRMGKSCEYKNFDIMQPQNDFNFEKRDWMTVKREELPSGNRLIMGLNPPFGVRGKLASQFAFHAARFKPKIIVLIVPKETKRLESHGYELIWEDRNLLKGPSFYLPGSVDVNENTMNQENHEAPPLYFWSRKDYANHHKKIAIKHGHVDGGVFPMQEVICYEKALVENICNETNEKEETAVHTMTMDLVTVTPREENVKPAKREDFVVFAPRSEVEAPKIQIAISEVPEAEESNFSHGLDNAEIVDNDKKQRVENENKDGADSCLDDDSQSQVCQSIEKEDKGFVNDRDKNSACKELLHGLDKDNINGVYLGSSRSPCKEESDTVYKAELDHDTNEQSPVEHVCKKKSENGELIKHNGDKTHFVSKMSSEQVIRSSCQKVSDCLDKGSKDRDKAMLVKGTTDGYNGSSRKSRHAKRKHTEVLEGPLGRNTAVDRRYDEYACDENSYARRGTGQERNVKRRRSSDYPFGRHNQNNYEWSSDADREHRRNHRENTSQNSRISDRQPFERHDRSQYYGRDYGRGQHEVTPQSARTTERQNDIVASNYPLVRENARHYVEHPLMDRGYEDLSPRQAWGHPRVPPNMERLPFDWRRESFPAHNLGRCPPDYSRESELYAREQEFNAGSGLGRLPPDIWREPELSAPIDYRIGPPAEYRRGQPLAANSFSFALPQSGPRLLDQENASFSQGLGLHNNKYYRR